jgi:hypothetical protein
MEDMMLTLFPNRKILGAVFDFKISATTLTLPEGLVDN